LHFIPVFLRLRVAGRLCSVKRHFIPTSLKLNADVFGNAQTDFISIVNYCVRVSYMTLQDFQVSLCSKLFHVFDRRCSLTAEKFCQYMTLAKCKVSAFLKDNKNIYLEKFGFHTIKNNKLKLHSFSDKISVTVLHF